MSNGTSSSFPQDGSLLLEEYKLIQAKIDKIGEDTFKVRSWCITLITGVLAGAKLSGALDDALTVVIVLIGCVPIIAAFHFLELYQRHLGRRLGIRAHNIELLWRRMLRKADIESAYAPGLASQMVREGRLPKTTDSSQVSQSGSNVRKHQFTDWLISRADMMFYVAQYGLLAVLLIVLIVSLFFRAGDASKQSSTLTILINTNEFRFGLTNHAVLSTNFVTVTQRTTNYVVVNQFTTNFIATNATPKTAVPLQLSPTPVLRQ